MAFVAKLQQTNTFIFETIDLTADSRLYTATGLFLKIAQATITILSDAYCYFHRVYCKSF